MTDTVAQEKKLLRQVLLTQRRAMSFAARAAADEAITKRLLSEPAYRAAKKVFAYVSMPHEVGTALLIRRILADGKLLGLPVCNPADSTLTFYRLDTPDELCSGAFRIPGPPVSPERLLTADADTLIVVPLLAFDSEGYRLGAGGGYYDRFLADIPCTAVGICYADFRQEHLPHDTFDRKLTSCITEKGGYIWPI